VEGGGRRGGVRVLLHSPYYTFRNGIIGFATNVWFQFSEINISRCSTAVGGCCIVVKTVRLMAAGHCEQSSNSVIRRRLGLASLLYRGNDANDIHCF